MVFGLFTKKDPICGMKEEKGKGITRFGTWFCHESCRAAYEQQMKKHKNSGGCCGH